MKIFSPAFPAGGLIPAKYSCDSQNINPPLSISQVPKQAKSLAIIVDDPDAPAGTWTHWLLWNIDPALQEITEDSIPPGAVEGLTSFGKRGYGGPCPPSGKHRYVFKLFALNSQLSLSPESGKETLEQAMAGRILARAELIGYYSRKD